MRKLFLSLVTVALLACIGHAQSSKLWTENERQYLLDNLIRSRDLLIKETQDLTPGQWNFKESPGKWSISQVVEHINFYELLYQREVSMALKSDPQPQPAADAKPDSVYLGYIME